MNKAIIISLAAVIAVATFLMMRGGNDSAGPATPTPTVNPVQDGSSAPSVSPTQAASPTQNPTPTPAPTQQSNTVTYTNSGYAPSTLTIKKGQTVTWQNNSSFTMWTASAIHPTHSVYPGSGVSVCGTAQAANIFDACTGVSPGQSWSFRFDHVGSWGYHNHNQASHTGRIIVE